MQCSATAKSNNCGTFLTLESKQAKRTTNKKSNRVIFNRWQKPTEIMFIMSVFRFQLFLSIAKCKSDMRSQLSTLNMKKKIIIQKPEIVFAWIEGWLFKSEKGKIIELSSEKMICFRLWLRDLTHIYRNRTLFQRSCTHNIIIKRFFLFSPSFFSMINTNFEMNVACAVCNVHFL